MPGPAQLAAALLSAALIFWLLMAPLAWILRDGLGPDAVASHGLEALTRALACFYWGPVALALFFARLFVGRRMAAHQSPHLSR